MISIHSLAFSVEANPGENALLLGSGVSRAAGILTGWETTLDLIRKLAKCYNEECVNLIPSNGMCDKFKKAADYSHLLDTLAKAHSERQQLLRPYFEPNDQELEVGAKQPSISHHAICTIGQARLAAKSLSQLALTYFLEKALDDSGIRPTHLEFA